MAARQAELTREEEFRYSELAMRWHGWGSPVGIGIFALLLGASAALIRIAFWGFA